MRATVLLPLVLAGCVGLDDTPIDPAAMYNGKSCASDADCGPDLCTSVLRCYEPGTFRSAHVHWSIDGTTPTQQSCDAIGDITLAVSESNGRGILVGPLACSEGVYSMPRLPNGFIHASLRQDTTGAKTDVLPFTTTGDVGFDLKW